MLLEHYVFGAYTVLCFFIMLTFFAQNLSADFPSFGFLILHIEEKLRNITTFSAAFFEIEVPIQRKSFLFIRLLCSEEI